MAMRYNPKHGKHKKSSEKPRLPPVSFYGRMVVRVCRWVWMLVRFVCVLRVSACALVCPVSCVSRHRVLSVVEGTSRAAQRAHLGPLDLPAQDAGRARGEDRLQRAITLQVVGGGPTGCAPREHLRAALDGSAPGGVDGRDVRTSYNMGGSPPQLTTSVEGRPS